MDTPYRIAKLVFTAILLYFFVQVFLFVFDYFYPKKDEVVAPQVQEEFVSEDLSEDETIEEEDSVEEADTPLPQAVYTRFEGFEKDENGKFVEVFKKVNSYGEEIKEVENNNSVEALQGQIKELNQKISSIQQGRRPGSITNVYGEIIYQGEEE